MPLSSDPLTAEPDPPTLGEGAEHVRLLPTVSVVEQSIGGARHAVIVMLASSLALIALVTGERWWFAAAQQEAARRHAEALRIAGDLRLLDEQLSQAAQMAVATGDREWIVRFDSLRPGFEALLAQARRLAPEQAIERFETDTRAANAELEGMRQSAFDAVAVREPATARAIFEGERYREKTALLRQATADFSVSTVATSRREIDDLRRRHAALGTALLAGVTLFGLLVWRRLARSREQFLRAEERVRRLASSDLLTGLPNRAALHDAMAGEFARATRDGGRLALLLIDLDGFKAVNDRHGHRAGDGVLREVSRRLTQVLRGGETRARYGGDEFVVLARDDGDAGEAHRLAARICSALTEPIDLGGLVVRIGASVGIARFPGDAQLADELLRKADSALYRAKAGNRGSACDYDQRVDDRIAERTALEQALREGLARGEIVAHLQPIVALADGRVQGVELLARWQHPQRGLLPPSEFVALAEACGLVDELTLAVLSSGCRSMKLLPAHWRMSLNLGAQQLRDEAIVAQLLAVLRQHDTPAGRLDLEITESALVADTAMARRVMAAMNRAGFTVTLDDFGTGYSSLAYLAEMPFDRIKIDRAFVAALRQPGAGTKVVAAIVGLSRSLGVPTVAEGIESADDALALHRMGCTYAQGWHFGRPVPAHELAASHATAAPVPPPSAVTA